MTKVNFEKRIFLGITGKEEKDWQTKLKDLTDLKINKAALFLERFDQAQRKKIYRALFNTTLKQIPLCHISNDMEIEELSFLESKFKTKYFNIHEKGFGFIDKWPGFEKKLYLEMDKNNYLSDKVMVEKIGGFCVDLSHFKAAEVEGTIESKYILERKNSVKFNCNHLNGYDGKNNTDLHTIKSLKDFNYLKNLPEFLFGKAIALEMENSIREQIKFRKYLVKLLNNLFN